MAMLAFLLESMEVHDGEPVMWDAKQRRDKDDMFEFREIHTNPGFHGRNTVIVAAIFGSSHAASSQRNQ